MSVPEVVQATAADRSAVVATVVAAFRADPALRYFFPDDATYDAHAAAFAGELFDRRVVHGAVWIAEGGAAVSMWDRPAPPAAADEPAPAQDVYPREVAARLEAYEAAVHAALPGGPFWYLGVLATRPERGRRGLGRAVMAAGLDHAAAAGLPAYLETTNPANVRLYERAGWEVVAALSVQRLPIWVMTRRAPGAPA